MREFGWTSRSFMNKKSFLKKNWDEGDWELEPDLRDELFKVIDDYLENFGDISLDSFREEPIRIFVVNLIAKAWEIFDTKAKNIATSGLKPSYVKKLFKIEEEHELKINDKSYFGRSDLSLHYFFKNSKNSLIPLVVETKKPDKLSRGIRQTVLYLLSAAKEADKVTTGKFVHFGICTDGNKWILISYRNKPQHIPTKVRNTFEIISIRRFFEYNKKNILKINPNFYF